MLKILGLKSEKQKYMDGLFAEIKQVKTNEDERKFCSLITNGRQLTDINVKNKEGNTLLHIAAAEGYYEIANTLIEEGARGENNLDKNAINKDGYTPLHLAAQKLKGGGNDDTQRKIIGLLLSKNAIVEIKGKNGELALHYAAKAGDEWAVYQLSMYYYDAKLKANNISDNRATLYIKDNNGLTPLDWAAKAGHKELIKRFGEGVEIPTENVLHKIMEFKKDDLDLNAKDSTASRTQNTMFKAMSLKKDKTSLFAAIAEVKTAEDEKKFCKQLKQSALDLNARDVRGNTLLHLVAEKRYYEVASTLFTISAKKNTDKLEVNAVNNDGYTALHIAAKKGTYDEDNGQKIIRLLVANHANVEAKGPAGEIPLHLAAMTGDTWMVRELSAFVYDEKLKELKVNNDRPTLYIKDNDGLTPLQWAGCYGKPHIIQEYGGITKAPTLGKI